MRMSRHTFSDRKEKEIVLREVLNRIGKNLEEILLEKGITKEKLSQICDIDKRWLTRLLGGRVVPSLRRLEMICEKLNIPVSMLFRVRFENMKLHNSSELKYLFYLVEQMERDEIELLVSLSETMKKQYKGG